MKVKLLRYFFVIFAILFVAFFTVFFYFLNKQNTVIPYESIGTVRINSGGKTYFCGGVLLGNYFVTVKHVFTNANLCIDTYRDIYIGKYVENVEGACVSVNGETYERMEIFLYERGDLAFIKLPSMSVNSKDAYTNEKLDVNTKYLLPLGEDFTYKKSNYVGLSIYGEKSLATFNKSVQKGASGYPVIDELGYVNGIICCRDLNKNVTYAIPIAEITSIMKILDEI